MLQALLSLIPLVSGATVTVQSAVNGKLRSILGNPLFISAISFAFGTFLLFVLMMILHLVGLYDIPASERVLQIEWWLYIGGVIGAIMVIGTIALPKKIGYAPFFSIYVSGQLFGSVIADAIGFLGTEVHEPSLLRLVGLACLVAGAVLIQKPHKTPAPSEETSQK